MIFFDSIKNLLARVWENSVKDSLPTKKVAVSSYSELSSNIPDSSIAIEEVFLQEDLEEIWNNYETYLGEFEVFPFLGTLGEAVICIGYGEDNKGQIFYFDFDFGCFPMDESLEIFLSRLQDENS